VGKIPLPALVLRIEMILRPLKLDRKTGKLIPETEAETAERNAAYVRKANAERPVADEDELEEET
jgi:hypothetical protein